MIINQIVHGSMDTSLHDFNISTNGMNVIFSPGSYYRDGNEIFSKQTETNFNIPTGAMNYQICLTNIGIELFSYTDEQGYVIVPNLIDNLVWFSIHEEIDLSDIDIHFLKIV